MKKILFVIGSLQLGGAETVMVDIINNIYTDYDITVLLITKDGSLLNVLTDKVKIKYLTKSNDYCNNLFEKVYNKIKRSLIYRYLGKNSFYVKKIYKKKLKENYDIEIPFLVGLPSEIVRRSPNSNSKKITWIHADVAGINDISYNKYLNVYKYFDKIIGVSEASIKTFEETFKESKGKIELINNFIDTNKIIEKAQLIIDVNYCKDKLNVLSIGRLVEEKGFDRIIKLAKKYEKEIKFNIIGDGPLKETLKNKIIENKISNVELLGLKTNPYPYIKQADAFLLSSRSEAYPTVVLEAMLLEKCIIATKVSGVEEILENYDNKFLVANDDNAIEKGIDEWLKNKNKKTNSKNEAFERKNKENLEKIKKILDE